ncbi:MAG: dTDP-4-dehydrorhamnose reductase, partial [Gammaproteobacteria bacterium]
ANITQIDDVVAAVRDADADVVVNAAAFTAVDRAETESDLAFSVNCDGARNIAIACAEWSLPMVQISTDYVFDGSKPSAYVEDDPVGPLGAYGASKEAGEQAVRDTLDRHVILRTSWVFGATGRNFVRTMLSLAEERGELAVVSDQFGCPTPAVDLAAAILKMLPLLSENYWGTYHYCGTGRTSWCDFASEIFVQRSRITNAPSPRLCPISTAEFPTPAARPANSELDCARFASTFDAVPRPWREGLADVLNELLAA